MITAAALRDAAPLIRSRVALQLLILLPEQLHQVHWMRLRTTEIARLLGTNSGNISRSLRILHGLGIIQRQGRGTGTHWRLSARWCRHDTRPPTLSFGTRWPRRTK